MSFVIVEDDMYSTDSSFTIETYTTTEERYEPRLFQTPEIEDDDKERMIQQIYYEIEDYIREHISEMINPLFEEKLLTYVSSVLIEEWTDIGIFTTDTDNYEETYRLVSFYKEKYYNELGKKYDEVLT